MSTPPFDLASLSLQQALKDFEAANARVIDLTQRLIHSESERRALAVEVEGLRRRLAAAEAVSPTVTTPRVLVRDLAARVRRRLRGPG